ncbi:sigma-70 family RNA polymerase sigma factor [Pseudoflavitalea sp. X16]|uniref:sigma-70 family RNA polymerase sigma factor n=1 Tax=Paraflavitalea devenefica TaxID=2716334 RepID=UPI00141DD5D2|nr:sigma-70 family RNA polymerase sigma factor [Paraflavitalea devenefica]NII25285.1 sigma-70 family RNA polymerase sigma factor [Paraflavitalea devenefica]
MNTIAAIQQGDTFIFEQVFHEYHEKLYFYVLHKTNSSWLAEETVQLTFIKLWQYRATLNESLELSPQLFRIANTTLIDLLRKQHHADRLAGKAGYRSESLVANDLSAQLDAAELAQRVQGAIRRMPLARRKVFEMSRLRGMSYREIAAELSLSVKTVENHIAHALKQLRHLITFLLVLIFK